MGAVACSSGLPKTVFGSFFGFIDPQVNVSLNLNVTGVDGFGWYSDPIKQSDKSILILEMIPDQEKVGCNLTVIGKLNTSTAFTAIGTYTCSPFICTGSNGSFTYTVKEVPISAATQNLSINQTVSASDVSYSEIEILDSTDVYMEIQSEQMASDDFGQATLSNGILTLVKINHGVTTDLLNSGYIVTIIGNDISQDMNAVTVVDGNTLQVTGYTGDVAQIVDFYQHLSSNQSQTVSVVATSVIDSSMITFDGTSVLQDGQKVTFLIQQATPILGEGIFDASSNSIVNLDSGYSLDAGSKNVQVVSTPTVVLPNPAAAAMSATVILDNGVIRALNIRDMNASAAIAVDMDLMTAAGNRQGLARFLQAGRDQVARTSADAIYTLATQPVADGGILVVKQHSGNVAFHFAGSNTPAQLAAITLAETRAGNAVYTAAQVKAAFAACPATYANAIQRQFWVQQNLATLFSNTTAPVARATRLGVTVAGIFANIGIEAGFMALTVIESIPDNLFYCQGRLQLVNSVSTIDADRCAISNKLFFTPININPIVDAQITVRPMGLNSGPARFWPYRIVDALGNVPMLDLSQPSPIPFSFDPVVLPAALRQSTIAGRPFDVFICAPSTEPDDGTAARIAAATSPTAQLALESFTAALGTYTASQLRRANNAPIPSNPSQLPRLFYMNWATNTQRRANGIGHYLVHDTNYGFLSLTTLRNNQTSTFDNNPGFITNPNQQGNGKYVYLGTMVPIASDGTCICWPGNRLVVNHMNKIGYNDFALESTYNFGPSSLTPENTNIPMKSGSESSVWIHNYLNPRTANNGLSTDSFFQYPRSGKLEIGVCGPLRVLAYNTSSSGSILMVHETDNEICVDSGNVDLTFKDINWSNITMPPTGYTDTGGFNTIEVFAKAPMGGMPALQKLQFIGDRRGANNCNYYYNQALGFITPNANANDVNSAAQTVVRSAMALFPNDLPVLDTENPLTGPNKGFGMQGEC